MDNIRIEATERTPEIDFSFADNTYALRGESYPEDINDFFGPLVDSLEKHLSNTGEEDVTFDFELIYFNSSSAKIMMILFELLDDAARRGNRVSINWIYEHDDDNMQDLGEEFGEELQHAEFKMVAQNA